MSCEFDKSIKFIIASETVYKKGHYGDLNYAVSTNIPGDDGGLTKFGIDFRSHPEVDIEKLNYEQAVEIYRKDYWDEAKCESLPYPLSLVHLDGAVNTGLTQQTKFLQRVCGADDDGKFGPKTLSLALKACEDRGVKEVCYDIVKHREKFYRDLAAKKPDKQKFLNGWLNRLTKLKTEIEVA
jgi:lysozyme family protein